ncbi:MAG: protein-disulfide reductase DsbD family protein [Roseibium sp.]|uniref:protein-disulfide reductase DsbD domain-containing protein n=1 Tax=Roseibium sp. TaxID=1936156 RepID=UPI003D9C0F8F
MTHLPNWCSSGDMTKTVLTFLAAFLCTLATARAAMTDWVEVHGGAVRLISSGPLQDGHYKAGLEFLMEPGWHTYWRYAGEAGIPPQISVTNSKNVGELDILYPVPERYNDGFSESIVYHDGIVLPFLVTPARAADPARLEIEVFFGICKDICVPGEASLSLDFHPEDRNDKLAGKLVQRDLAAVPGAGPAHGLEFKSVTFDGGDYIMIETQVGDHRDVDLFAAGPEGSFIGLPKLVTNADGVAVWRLSTKGLVTAPDDDQLRLVLTANGSGIEQLERIQPEWLK